MKIKVSFSKLVSLVIFCVFIVTQFIDNPWNRDGGVIKSDVKGYYAYLPALFIHNDLRFENKDVYWENNESKVWYNESQNGVRYIKYTIGTSLLYAPFFGVAHVYAGLTEYPQDGFSKPYLFALCMSALFFLGIALFFMRKILVLYFSETATALTLLIVFLGSNTWNYYTFDACYSHGYSLAIVTLFIYGSIRWLNTARYKYALWMGFSFGLIILIRPVDIVYGLIPLLLFVTSIETFKERLYFFIDNWKQATIILLITVLCLFPQMLYFKYISGDWIFYTYTDESFFFLNPKWLEAMFSFRNGWLIYSPLMLLSLLGFFFLRKRKEKIFLVSFLVFVLYTFIISSWWCWWYVGFGNRAFINLYPILSFPLATIITVVIEKRWRWKGFFVITILVGITLSIFQTLQYNRGLIHWGYMSKKAYLDSFLKWNPSPLFETYLEIPIDKQAIKGVNKVYSRKIDTLSIYNLDFEKKLLTDTKYNDFIQSKISFKGKSSLFLPDWFEYFLNKKLNVKNANRVYASAWVYNPDEFSLCLSSENGHYNTLSSQIVDKKNGWNKIELYAVIPEEEHGQPFNFFIWKKNRNNAYIDNVEIVITHEELVE